MKLIIGADIVPTKSNEQYFINGDVIGLVGKPLLDILNSADFKVFNLEAPLTYNKTHIEKSGPVLKANPLVINGLKKLGVNLLTLANNHILDYSEKGLFDTINSLDENGIAYIGAGRDYSAAKKTKVFEVEGVRLGFYACAEHEFSIATRKTAGANPFDVIQSYSQIAKLRKNCDFLVVLYHGGKEYYRYPSPKLQRYCRTFVDSGADLVICQHSHCVGTKEKYKDKEIVYGQGNFIFDEGNDEFWNSSVLLEIKLEKDRKPRIRYIPVVKENSTIRLAQTEEGNTILNDFINRSKQIEHDSGVSARYSEFANKYITNYLVALSPKESFLFRVLNKLSYNRLREARLRRIYSDRKLLTILNYIECEAHQELIIQGLKNRLRHN